MGCKANVCTVVCDVAQDTTGSGTFGPTNPGCATGSCIASAFAESIYMDLIRNGIGHTSTVEMSFRKANRGFCTPLAAVGEACGASGPYCDIGLNLKAFNGNKATVDHAACVVQSDGSEKCTEIKTDGEQCTGGARASENGEDTWNTAMSTGTFTPAGQVPWPTSGCSVDVDQDTRYESTINQACPQNGRTLPDQIYLKLGTYQTQCPAGICNAEVPSICDEVAAGDTCAADWECGLYMNCVTEDSVGTCRAKCSTAGYSLHSFVDYYDIPRPSEGWHGVDPPPWGGQKKAELPCSATTYCELESCLPRKAEGDTCDSSIFRTCAEGSFCSSSICTAQKAIDSPCTASAQCLGNDWSKVNTNEEHVICAICDVSIGPEGTGVQHAVACEGDRAETLGSIEESGTQTTDYVTVTEGVCKKTDKGLTFEQEDMMAMILTVLVTILAVLCGIAIMCAIVGAVFAKVQNKKQPAVYVVKAAGTPGAQTVTYSPGEKLGTYFFLPAKGGQKGDKGPYAIVPPKGCLGPKPPQVPEWAAAEAGALESFNSVDALVTDLPRSGMMKMIDRKTIKMTLEGDWMMKLNGHLASHGFVAVFDKPRGMAIPLHIHRGVAA